AMAHLNLVMIHPFKDGNGRMARCLQTLLLACGDTFPALEFASIEEYLGWHQQEYYQVLAKVGGGTWNPAGDAHPWVRFCLTAHYRQTQEIIRRSKLASEFWTMAEEEARTAGLSERSVQPLAFALTGRTLRNSTYRQLTDDLSTVVAGRDLTRMTQAGLLVSRGEKRGRVYVTSVRLRQLSADIATRINQESPVDGDPYREVA
ncbi:MAG TPA: Fic family protein, partial [Pseudonocardiaceae bacterium]|nr:Fic family protein [Pseudonocardiaceae bacterium]